MSKRAFNSESAVQPRFQQPRYEPLSGKRSGDPLAPMPPSKAPLPPPMGEHAPCFSVGDICRLVASELERQEATLRLAYTELLDSQCAEQYQRFIHLQRDTVDAPAQPMAYLS